MGGHARKGARDFLLLAASASLLVALAGDAAAERLPIKAYTIENGLAHNRVKRIVQDSHGFLWFCTGGGLSRFDGSQFVTYSADDGLLAPSLNDVVETSDGVYWMATNSDGVVPVRLDDARTFYAVGNSLAVHAYPVSSEPVTNRVNVLYRDPRGCSGRAPTGDSFVWMSVQVRRSSACQPRHSVPSGHSGPGVDTALKTAWAICGLAPNSVSSDANAMVA